MSGVLMSIGDAESGGPIYFFVPQPDQDTPSFETVQKDSQFTWTSQGRLSRHPAMQFTGPGEETISIAGRLFPFQFGGTSTLDALRAAGAAGKPMQLMRFSTIQEDDLSYVGQFVGNYVIRRVRSDSTKFAGTGTPHKMDFTIELALYGDDLATIDNLFTLPTTTQDGTLSDGTPAPSAPDGGAATSTTTPNADGGSTTSIGFSGDV